MIGCIRALYTVVGVRDYIKKVSNSISFPSLCVHCEFFLPLTVFPFVCFSLLTNVVAFNAKVFVQYNRALRLGTLYFGFCLHQNLPCFTVKQFHWRGCHIYKIFFIKGRFFFN